MGIISALFGGKTGKEKRQEREFEQMFAPIIQQQAGAQSYALDQSKQTFGQFQDMLKLPADYWSKILSGDLGALMEILGPETQAIEGAYQNQAQSNAEFNPRGGGEILQNTTLQSEKMRSIGDMILKVRPDAADSLSQLSSLLANLALGQMNAGTGAGASAIGGLLSKRDQDANAYRARVANLNQQMQGLGQFIAML